MLTPLVALCDFYIIKRIHHGHHPDPRASTRTLSFTSSAVLQELPSQAAQPVKTSSSKKRKLARPSSTRHPDSLPGSPSPDTALPSCEPADDDQDLDDDLDAAATFSFTTSADHSRLSLHRDSSPAYLRSDSLQPQPASSLPARLQAAAHQPNPSLADDRSSAASSPCASAYAGLSLDGERRIDEAGSVLTTSLPRSQSPLRVPRRAIMNGDAELPHRSSSPLKRRASSMDPDQDAQSRNGDDVNMNSSQTTATAKSADAPRAMSVDPPDGAGAAATAATQSKFGSQHATSWLPARATTRTETRRDKN